MIEIPRVKKITPKISKSATATPLLKLEKKVYLQLREYKPLLQNQKVIMAVSGGVDSVSLLHVFKALQTRLGVKIHVVHINHGVRGSASDSDARFVRDLCRKLQIPLSFKKLSGLKTSASENILRSHRYQELLKVKEKQNAEFIVVAHHKDDLLETRLMRLLQGTGIHGLHAMKVLNSENVLRPFLAITRNEIETYAREKRLSWRNDATNKDTTKLRNWIRRQWLGLLRKDHPQYVQNLFDGLEKVVSSNSPKTLIYPYFLRAQYHDTDLIYEFLKTHAKERITSRHVYEFQKHLQRKQKEFRLRLAKTDWQVTKDRVAAV